MHPRAKAAYLAELIEGSKRAARHTTCQRCDEEILTGDDHDNCAAVAHVDTQPLTPGEEMIAIFTGRSTYDLIKATGKTSKPGTFHLYRREPWNLDNHQHPVLAEHQCERTAA